MVMAHAVDTMHGAWLCRALRLPLKQLGAGRLLAQPFDVVEGAHRRLRGSRQHHAGSQVPSMHLLADERLWATSLMRFCSQPVMMSADRAVVTQEK